MNFEKPTKGAYTLHGKPTFGPLSRATALAVALVEGGFMRGDAMTVARQCFPGAEKLPRSVFERSVNHYLSSAG